MGSRFRPVFALALASFVLVGVNGRAWAQEPATPTPTPTPPPVSIDHHGSTSYSILMKSLYATTIVVQALDVHSTFRGLDAGGKEVNPFMRAMTSSKPVFIAFKACVATAAIYGGSKLARKHKVWGPLSLVAVNVGYGFVVARNYRNARISRERLQQADQGGAVMAFAFRLRL